MSSGAVATDFKTIDSLANYCHRILFSWDLKVLEDRPNDKLSSLKIGANTQGLKVKFRLTPLPPAGFNPPFYPDRSHRQGAS